MDIHEQWMREAIIEAQRAAAMNEVPIGAVAVVNSAILGRAHNIREATNDPLGHAELLLLQKLSHFHQSWRLTDVTIYVTCEPCLMCAGAMLQARIPRLVYGCRDPKAGACGSLYDVVADPRLNHRIDVVSGVVAEECGKLLSDYFKILRLDK
ncbi:MAG: nucleoside deaminase [Deltaproteobacteria bacterium]|nr:nucleoside deaminase [Deltaproteobacteria bacterium]